MSWDPRFSYTVAGPSLDTPPPLAFPASFDGAVRELARIGYDGIEVQVGDPEELATDAVRATLDEAGIRVAVLATGPFSQRGLSLCHADEEARVATVAGLRRLVEVAGEFDAAVSLGQVIYSHGDGTRSRSDRLERAARSFSELLGHAEGHGVKLLVEPQNPHLTDLLTTVAQTRDFLENLAPTTPAGAGIIVDLYHLALTETSLEAALVAAGDRLAHVQFADSNRGRPGTGTFSFSSVLRTLEYLGYRGWITLEHRQDANEQTAALALALLSSTLGKPVRSAAGVDRGLEPVVGVARS